MEHTGTKSFLYMIIFSTLSALGYVVGLITFPVPKPIIAVKEATITLESADTIDDSGNDYSENNNELQPLVIREINPFTGKSPKNSPFSGGKIMDIPQRKKVSSNNKVSDPRITIVQQDSFSSGDPMGSTSGEVEIEMSNQEDEVSEINKPSMINSLSLVTKKTEKHTLSPDKIRDPYAPRTPLVSAPVIGYAEKNALGLLPQSPQGQPPLWQIYSNQTRIDDNKRPIAYILAGLGENYNLTVEAIKTLPSQVTLGFKPYTNNLQELVNLARQYGHEVILEIPMETHDTSRQDIGYLALKTDDTDTDYRNKLKTLLSRVTGYSGVMNYAGSKYLLDENISLRLLNDLKSRGLYFVENKTIRSGILSEIAEANNIPYATSFDIIDEVLSPSMINTNINVIEKNALVQTPIIATGYLSSLTLSLLRVKMMSYYYNTQSDIQLIPISAYIAYGNS